jgi:hypothetical protein
MDLLKRIRHTTQSAIIGAEFPIPSPTGKEADEVIVQPVYDALEACQNEDTDFTEIRSILERPPDRLNKAVGEDLIWWAVRNLAWKWALTTQLRGEAGGMESESDDEIIPESAWGGRVERSAAKPKPKPKPRAKSKPKAGAKKGTKKAAIQWLPAISREKWDKALVGIRILMPVLRLTSNTGEIATQIGFRSTGEHVLARPWTGFRGG